MWNVAISDMVRLKCKMCEVELIWRGVACGVMVCGMLHNTRCGNLRCDVKLLCCGIVLMKNVTHAMCCAIVVRCKMWKMMQCVVSDVRSGGVMRCGIWCGVKYAVMLNVGVVWYSCEYGMV